jgi:exodeoxyribonuclease I
VAFVLYDVETLGLNKRFDQILQFAAVRTDADLVETHRFETRSRLMPQVVPSPRALHVTGMSLEDANSMSRPSHYSMVCKIAKTLASWCPATFLGSIR